MAQTYFTVITFTAFSCCSRWHLQRGSPNSQSPHKHHLYAFKLRSCCCCNCNFFEFAPWHIYGWPKLPKQLTHLSLHMCMCVCATSHWPHNRRKFVGLKLSLALVVWTAKCSCYSYTGIQIPKCVHEYICILAYEKLLSAFCYYIIIQNLQFDCESVPRALQVLKKEKAE